MVKTIKRHGNGSAIPLDRTILDQLGVEPGDQVQITCTNGSLVVTPVNTFIADEQFSRSQARMFKRYKTTLKHLAE